jgi:hypothetical protein
MGISMWCHNQTSLKKLKEDNAQLRARGDDYPQYNLEESDVVISRKYKIINLMNLINLLDI